MAETTGALATTPHGTIISIEVSTGSKSDSFPTSYNPWRKTLGCQVSAQPIDGKANIAIIVLIALVLGVSRNDVDIVSGLSSSQKRVLIRGLSIDEVKLRLERSTKN